MLAVVLGADLMAAATDLLTAYLSLELVSLLFIGVFFRYSLQLVLKSQEVTAVFQIPKAVLYSSMPISAGIMVLYSVGAVLVELAGVFGRKT